jgi:hypothetical protein
MSVVATVKVYDGIVLGAESMTQLIANVPGKPPQLVKAYENAQKLFHIGEDLPIGLLTYGIGNIGRRSVESFAHEFSRQEVARKDPRVNVEDTARRFYTFIQGNYVQAFGALPPEQQPAMGFIVAGYSYGEHFATVQEFVLPKSTEPVSVGPQESVGASWRGVSVPFTRLMFGLDPTVEKTLREKGCKEAELQQLKATLSTLVAFDGMPLSDAVGYCKFIIQTTIGWCKYALGQAACGGPIRLATITPGAGFEWITPPKTYLGG